MNILTNKNAFVALLAAMALLVCSFACMLVAPSAVVEAADAGDTTVDGIVNMMDVMSLYNHASGKAVITDAEALAAGDTNGDGIVNMMDVMALYNHASGKATLPTTTTTTTTTQPVVEEIDMLVYSKVAETSNVTVSELDGGGWLIEATAAGSVGIQGPGTYDASVLKYTHISMKSDVPFTVAFYDAANGKWMTSAGDFFPQFGLSTTDLPAPAGEYDLSLYTNGCYTWDGSALPETVQMSSIYIEPQAAGNIVISHLMLSKGDTCSHDIPSVTLPTTEATTTTRYMQGEVVTYTAGSATASVGDTIQIPLTVTENHYMVNGQIFVEYDPEVLEIQEVWDDEDNPYFEDINTKIFKSTYMWAFAVPEAGKARLAFASSSSVGTTAGGEMYFLTFKVLDTAATETVVKIDIPEMCSNDGSTNGGADFNTNVAIVNGVVTIA